MIRDFFKHTPFTMIATAPEGSPQRWISTNNSKKTLPAMPRRGPEAGFHRIHYDFHGLGANTLFMPVSTELENYENPLSRMVTG
jgi:hypothetical protein